MERNLKLELDTLNEAGYIIDRGNVRGVLGLGTSEDIGTENRTLDLGGEKEVIKYERGPDGKVRVVK